MKARVHITLKNGVLDPQGKAIHNSLEGLGFDGVDGVRQGKFIELELADGDAEAARTRVAEMCEKLFANMGKISRKIFMEDMSLRYANGAPAGGNNNAIHRLNTTIREIEKKRHTSLHMTKTLVDPACLLKSKRGRGFRRQQSCDRPW